MKNWAFTAFSRNLRTVALLVGAGLALSGCADLGLGGSTLDELAATQPTGSPFTQALFQDYSFLARSFGELQDVESDDWYNPFTSENPLQPLQDSYATKALLAAGGEEVAPEAAPTTESRALRARLVAAIASGKGSFPDDAARAQAQFDCWILNGLAPGQGAAAAQCRRGLDGALAKLEREIRGGSAEAAPVAAPVAPVQAASAAPDGYTVYFDFDSWSLSAEALSVITSAVNNARAGGQSRIDIVGHTDTAGSADYNQNLSVRRANVVMEAMVQMGARREAITVSGVGENDLAVATADGVREPKNRRAVVTLAM